MIIDSISLPRRRLWLRLGNFASLVRLDAITMSKFLAKCLVHVQIIFIEGLIIRPAFGASIWFGHVRSHSL